MPETLAREEISTTAPTAPRYYLYAVTRADTMFDPDLLPGVAASPAASPAPVEVLVEGGLGVLVSPVPAARIRPERRNLAAHQGVLRALAGAGEPSLPVSFGVMAPARTELRALVRANHDALLAELERIGGMVEMGLFLRWDVPNVFEFLLDANRELALCRDELLAKPGGPSHHERIEMGRMFEAVLQGAREGHRAVLSRALAGAVQEIASDPPRDERTILSLACLVDRDGEAAFEKAVLAAAELFDDNYSFDYSGPWPPFHFVRVSLGEPG
ncbi:MAG: GvpL/GvpF family gas vesicle protein [Planctomycetes bacterium]|nr:GvpL/GvpF family gas vesicle protein [Planctomycetota bacterium]